MKFLLDQNCSLTLKDEDERTAFDVVEKNGRKEIKRMIYQKMIETLSSKSELLTKRKDCIVCCQPRQGTFAFLPCGHARTCEKCCTKIVEETKMCPLCRDTVTQFKKIFD